MSNAARVTPDHIQDCIAGEQYQVLDGTTVTVCLLHLRNGAKVIGYNYGSISVENQDWDLARVNAKAMAVEKVWELEGYLLRQRLHEEALAKEYPNFRSSTTDSGV